ncbi:peptide ABC transporter substrate-binding protein [Jiangella anatolica]|uniref:Peptide ABC transporter substrate-binding protein n=1 Tax=Jiangella anatolica TaxID=2670374 RepID=A0A2W2C953_9ACTN|nr:peptide ABC transporter substrate-binding protein [Jiangella anatolica]
MVVAFVAAGLVAAGCGASSDPSGGRGDEVPYAEDGTFTMALLEDLGSLDPYRGTAFRVDRLAYDSLVNLQPDGRFVSGLAEEWTADALSARFVLRDDITCSDGTPLTASDVAAAISYVSDPENGSGQYGINTPTVPLTATGDDATRTVTVALEQPFAFLLNTIGLLPIVCRAGMEDPDLLATASAGTGPFVVTDIVPGQSYTFTRRDGYTWGPGGAGTSEPGTPATIVVRIVPNETTAANLLLSGEVNYAKISGQDQQRLAEQSFDTLEVAAPGAGLRFNQNEADGRVGADQRVRQALVQALDLEEVIQVSTGGTGRAATSLVQVEPRACAGDNVSGHLPEHDPGAAEALLDQAGWVRGPDGVRVKDGTPLMLDLHYLPSSSSYEKPTVELIAQKWEALGAQVTLTADTTVGYSDVLFEHRNWDAVMQLGTAYLPSAWVPFLSGPLPPEGTNLGGVNEDYEELVAQAATMTPPEACDYWNRAEQALYRDLDIVPISDRIDVFYLRRAEAEAAGYVNPIPTSIRLLD